jgi:DUF4097 and DUF4098 domain-containing protein YvlB
MVKPVLPAILFGTLVLGGCGFDHWVGATDRFKADFDLSYPLSPGSRVTLESFNGSVAIEAWDRDEVHIKGTRYAATEEMLAELKTDVVNEAGAIRIRSVRPSGWHWRTGGVSYVIQVPRRSTLTRIATSNGSITLTGTEGDATLVSSNGRAVVTGVKGKLEVTTSNGRIEISSHAGAAHLKTSNGRIKVEGTNGPLDAQTSNGRIEAQLGQLEAGSAVRLATSNGGIDLSLARIHDNEVSARTSNSGIQLRLPADANAHLKAATSNGRIDSDLTLRTSDFTKNHCEGDLGQGGALIDLKTSNGRIKLLRAE